MNPTLAGILYALGGLVVAAIAIRELVRGETKIAGTSFTRAHHPLLYWCWLLFTACLAVAAFILAVRSFGGF